MSNKDKQTYSDIKERVREMYEYRVADTEVYEEGYENFWAWARKAYMMWSKKVFDDVGRERSNMKSPLLAGVIEAMMGEWNSQNYNIHFVDKFSSKGSNLLVAEKITEALMFGEYKFKEKASPFVKDGFITGTSFLLNKYFLRKRKVKIMKEGAKAKLEKGNKDVWEDVVKIDYDGTDYIPVPVENVLWNEMATDFGINTNSITELAWFQYVGLEEAKAQLKDNPFAKNLDDIQPSSNREIYSDVIFQPVKDTGSQKGVEVIWYFNTIEDRFVVLIGDRVCLDIPMPNNNKIIPFSKFTPFPIPYSPYGLGYAAKLRSIMNEEEIARDGYADLLKINLNRRVFVDAMAYGEYVEGLTGGDMGTIIPVSDVNAMKWEDIPNLNLQQVAATRQMTRDDATVATGVDPRNLGFSVRSSTATDAALNKEASTKLTGLVLKEVQRAIKQSTMHTISDIKQYTAIPEKLLTTLEMKDIVKKYKVVPLDGYEVVDTDDGKKLKKKNGRTPVAVTKELFDFEAFEVEIQVEALPELSKGLQMKKMEEQTAQLGPLIGDPDVPVQPGMPKPLIDRNKWYTLYLQTHDIPEDMLINQDATLDDAITRAFMQNRELEENEVEGIPGEPRQHLDIHRRQIDFYDQVLEQMSQNGASMDEIMAIYTIRDRNVSHLAEDGMQEATVIDEAVQDAINVEAQEEGQLTQPGMSMNPGIEQGMQQASESTIDPAQQIQDMMAGMAPEEAPGVIGRPTAFANPMQSGVGLPGPEMRPQSEDMSGMQPPESVGA